MVPVTLAGSADGDLQPARILPALAARLPHVRLQRYASLSHFGPMEDPLRVAADIVAAVSPGAGSHRPVTPDR